MSEEVKNEVTSTEGEVSKSKLKREQRKAEAKAAKRKHNIDSIIGTAIGIVIAAVVIVVIVLGIIQSVDKTTAKADYSAGLTEDGRVKGANLNAVKDIGLDSLSVDYSEVEYTDEEVENAITSLCSGKATYSDDKTLTVKDGDSINLDYVGYVDDVAFDGGNTNGAGTTLVIGSGSYIDTFEQQLIGSHPGDSVTVNVTFPEEYASNPDLAGKPARFECVINSIRVVPEFTDEFVKENYSDVASTAAEYRAYLKDQGYQSNLKTYIADYIQDNASSSSAPHAYVKALRSLTKYMDEQNYEYYNYMYQTYYGYAMYSDFNSYTGMNDNDYEKHLKKTAKTQAAVAMTFEAYADKKGITVSDEDYAAFVEEAGGEAIAENYGTAYMKQAALQNAVIEYLAENITVNQ
ncbi:MAG: FKBP-type peptidyl-prolyl cis-trans isomerase [Lachnospiraceae bacterium]|nr:FKBP-type peptidyl-prolyl cis-trans isomerase [Lachnospiraceae bacterium]